MRGRPAAALVVSRVIAAKLAGNIDGVAPSEREVRGVADHDIEAPICKHLGKLLLPVERLGSAGDGAPPRVDERVTGAQMAAYPRQSGQHLRCARCARAIAASE